MNTTFEKYLDTIDKCLKPLPTSERVDIVKEIKGSILEMESENLSTEQILTRLGKPKDLAKAYLGDLLAKENGFSWNRFLTVCAFYSLVGFSGLFVIPVLVIVAPTFILCGVASAVLGIIKLVDYLLHLNIPYVDYIGFQFGNIALSPIPVFILSLITGIPLYFRYGYSKAKIYCLIPFVLVMLFVMLPSFIGSLANIISFAMEHDIFINILSILISLFILGVSYCFSIRGYKKRK